MEADPSPSPYEDVLDRPATRRLVLRLAAEGYLDPVARDAALRLLHPGRGWWLWAGRLLLAGGFALVLAGVVFFFAFNWAAIPPPAKLGLVQALAAALAVAAWARGLDSHVGQALLLGASVALGALLAVFGQVYQTGADAFELFVGWAALSAVWVAVSRSAAHWMLWIAIVDFAIALFWEQVLVPSGAASWESGLVALAAVNLLALAARELGAERVAWLAARWTRWALWASALAFLTMPAAAFVGDLSDEAHPETLAALAVALAVGYWHFRWRVRDLPAVTLGTLSLCVIVLTAVARLFEGGKELALLSFGFVVLAVFSTATIWLRAVGAAMDRERGHG